MLFNSSGQHTAPLFVKNVPYDPATAFTPIITIASVPNVLVVHPSIPAKTVAEFVAYVKKNGKMFYGTAGLGTTHHIAGLRLQQVTGMDFEHVVYKGGAPSINDVIGGQIPSAILTATTVMPFVREGKLRALGITESKPSELVPGVPPIHDSLPEFDIPPTYIGAIAPAGIPAPIVAKLNAELAKVIQDPQIAQKLHDIGYAPHVSSAEEYTAALKRDVALFGDIVTKAGIKPE
jgi:tripartite-type tricarboxylate transporter receptor subunit TctC